MRKELPKKEYNNQGQLVYSRTPKGDEEWWMYNNNGREIRYWNSGGYLIMREYTEGKIKTYYQNTLGEVSIEETSR